MLPPTEVQTEFYANAENYYLQSAKIILDTFKYDVETLNRNNREAYIDRSTELDGGVKHSKIEPI